MKINTRQVKGKGRGKLLGYPTINLKIPLDLNLQHGIYAAWVTIAGKRWQAALHFGPVPTFDESEASLEVFLLDATDADFAGVEEKEIGVEFVKMLREIQTFGSQEELKAQIAKDVEETRKILGAS